MTKRLCATFSREDSRAKHVPIASQSQPRLEQNVGAHAYHWFYLSHANRTECDGSYEPWAFAWMYLLLTKLLRSANDAWAISLTNVSKKY